MKSVTNDDMMTNAKEVYDMMLITNWTTKKLRNEKQRIFLIYYNLLKF